MRCAGAAEELSRAVQGLQEQAELLNRQVAAQAAELDRLRSDLDGQSFRAALLPGKVEQMQGQIDLLQRQISPLTGQLDQMQMQLDSLERTASPRVSRLDAGAPTDGGSGQKPGWLWDRWRQQDKPPANGETSAPNGWLRQRLNGLWLW